MSGKTEKRKGRSAKAEVTRRLRRVDPSNAGKILGHERYWTVQFIRGYLERCEDLVWMEPQAAHDLVRFMPMLITRLATVGPRPTDIPTEPDRQSLYVWSLALLASSHQQLDQRLEARRIFDKANRTLGRRSTAPSGEATLLYYEARSSPQCPEALPKIDRAFEIYSELGDTNAAAQAQMILGIVQREHRLNSGALAWTRALELADGKTARGRQIFQEALDLLLEAAKNDLFLTDQENVVLRLGKLARNQRRSRRAEVPSYLQWTVGQMYLNLGISAYGRQWLTRARAGFESLGRAEEFVEITLTMAESMQSPLEKPELAPLALNTEQRLMNLDRRDLANRIKLWFKRPESSEVVRRLRKDRVWIVPSSPEEEAFQRLGYEWPSTDEERAKLLQKLLPDLRQQLLATDRDQSLRDLYFTSDIH